MLPQLSVALDDLSDLADAAERMTRKVERDPSGFIAGETVPRVSLEKRINGIDNAENSEIPARGDPTDFSAYDGAANGLRDIVT